MSVLSRGWKFDQDYPRNNGRKLAEKEWPTLADAQRIRVKAKNDLPADPKSIGLSPSISYDTTDVKCDVVVKQAKHGIPSHVSCTRCDYRYKLHEYDHERYNDHVNKGKDLDKFGMCLQCRLYMVLDNHNMVPGECRKCSKFFWIKPHHKYWDKARDEYKEFHLINLNELCPCCWHEPQFIKVNRAEPMKEPWALAACRIKSQKEKQI